MREIKFRVWDKSKAVMNNFPQQMNMDKNGLIKYDRFVWMQYTGLSDKNGVEIYEGDIVKGLGDIVLQVYFDECHLQYRLKNSKCDREMDYFGKLEVICNIYKNPELLEVK